MVWYGLKCFGLVWKAQNPQPLVSHSVSDEGGHRAARAAKKESKEEEDGGGEADRHKPADGKDGEQGEADVDQHLLDYDAHHLIVKGVHGQQPDKESTVKLLARLS